MHTSTATITDQFAGDVLTTAVEGGCSYWASVRDVIRDDSLTVISASFREAEDTSADRMKITLASIAEGIRRVLTPGFSVRDDLRALIAHAATENDASNIDAKAADVIVQAAAYGEIVF